MRRDDPYWGRYASVGAHVPVKLREKLDAIASEVGCKPSEIVEEALEQTLEIPLDVDWQDMADLRREVVDQQRHIAELEDQLKQLEGAPCPVCEGTGVQSPPESSIWKKRMARAEEAKRILSHPLFPALVDSILTQEVEADDITPEAGAEKVAGNGVDGDTGREQGDGLRNLPREDSEQCEVGEDLPGPDGAGAQVGVETGVPWIDEGYRPAKKMRAKPPTFEAFP